MADHYKCPICQNPVKQSLINQHIDSGCQDNIITESTNAPSTVVSGFFQPSSSRNNEAHTKPGASKPTPSENGTKRRLDEEFASKPIPAESPLSKRPKINHLQAAAPLAERMRPRTLDQVYGQELVGRGGVIRGLIDEDKVPSMILWGASGTGKTTIARIIAHSVGSRFVEINSTTSGVQELKKIFAEARNELQLTGRKTILFCDEIHRFSKSQQDVFLGPVEAGQITLIGATTENPSFKVVNALLSRCRTFTLTKLSGNDVVTIMERALEVECPDSRPKLLDQEFLNYLASFADGDARTALNLLELSLNLSSQPNMTLSTLKSSLTQTMVYDRAGDQHYDVSISSNHAALLIPGLLDNISTS
jgi:putative ATPase